MCAQQCMDEDVGLYVANKTHITQITCKFINNAMLTHNTLLMAMLQFSAHKNTGRL